MRIAYISRHMYVECLVTTRKKKKKPSPEGALSNSVERVLQLKDVYFKNNDL